MPVTNRTTLLNVEEAAEVLGCTGARIRQMLLSGELKGMKASDSPKSLWLVPKAAVLSAAKKERRRGGRPRIRD